MLTGLLTFVAALLVGAVGTSPVLAVLWLSDRLAQVEPKPKPQGRHRPARGRTRATVLIGETR